MERPTDLVREETVQEPRAPYVDQGVLPLGLLTIGKTVLAECQPEGDESSEPASNGLAASSTNAKEIRVVFRNLSQRIPSTTYGTFGLYRYPAKFIPQVVSYIFDHYGQAGKSVIDPFAGSGTTGLVARLYGMPYELWDLNPLLTILHRVAIMDPVPVRVDQLIDELRHSREHFVPEWSRLTYWFPEPVIEILSHLFGYYHALPESPVKWLLAVPLLKVMRKFSYNDHQRQKLSRSPVAMRRVETLMQGDWQAQLFTMLADEIRSVQRKLTEYQSLLPESQPDLPYQICAGIDGIEQSAYTNGEWDMLVTSPPYLQAQEYIRCSKLDLFWLGFSEETIRQLARCELPYRQVSPIPIFSETYHRIHQSIGETHLRSMFERYFYGVLTIITNLSNRVRERMFLFVGPASVRSVPVPIDQIFWEHFCSLGWEHEATLIDSIVARVMFRSNKNPATGLADYRMSTEHLVILRRK
jgi:hypothetical protein